MRAGFQQKGGRPLSGGGMLHGRRDVHGASLVGDPFLREACQEALQSAVLGPVAE